ncbi:MAG: glycosyltransferase family 2 protein [Burkholderiaceae bacterium]
MRLSVIIIARNEAHNIGPCLAGLAFADERIVVDGGSTDQTVAIARAAGATVHVHADWPGFGPQKNRALAYATGDWVLSVDADERIGAALAAQIRGAIDSDAHVAYEIPRRTEFLGTWIAHCGWTPDRVLRLFRRDGARFSDALVHERVEPPPGPVGRLSAVIDHHSYPDLSAYWRKTAQYAELWAHQQHAAGRRASLAQALASGASTFVRAYLLRLGFLDGGPGLVLCVLLAHGAFLKYVTLIDLGRREPEPLAGQEVK